MRGSRTTSPRRAGWGEPARRGAGGVWPLESGQSAEVSRRGSWDSTINGKGSVRSNGKVPRGPRQGLTRVNYTCNTTAVETRDSEPPYQSGAGMSEHQLTDLQISIMRV